MIDYILTILAVALIFFFLLFRGIYWYRRYLREHEQLELLKRQKSKKKTILVSAKILETTFDDWSESFGYEKRVDSIHSGLYIPIIFDPSTGEVYPAEISDRIIAEGNYFLIPDNYDRYRDFIWTNLQIPRFKFVDGVCGQIELLGEPYSFRAMKKKSK